VDNIERSKVAFSVKNNSNSSHVAPSSDHDDVTDLELDEVGDLSSLEVELDGIVDSDEGIGVSDSASVVQNDEGDSLRSNLELLDLSELVLSLICRNRLKNKSSLSVVEESEVLSGLVDGDDILKSGGVSAVSSNLSIDLDESLHNDLGDFISSKGVFQSVSQHDNEGKALS